MTPKRSAGLQYLRRAGLYFGVFAAVFLIVAGVYTFSSTHSYRARYRLTLPERELRSADLARVGEALRERLDALSDSLKLSGGTVRTVSPDCVEIEFRSRHDPAVAFTWLTMPGRVEFRLVHPVENVPAAGEQETLPDRYELKTYRGEHYRLSPPRRLEIVEQSYVLEREPALRIQGFQEVDVRTVGLHGRCVLTFHFREEDADRFADLTALHAGRRLAMLVDGEMFFPPAQIGSSVTEGVVQVDGYFNRGPLEKLGAVLGTGPLPGRLAKVELADPAS